MEVRVHRFEIIEIVACKGIADCDGLLPPFAGSLFCNVFGIGFLAGLVIRPNEEAEPEAFAAVFSDEEGFCVLIIRIVITVIRKVR